MGGGGGGANEHSNGKCPDASLLVNSPMGSSMAFRPDEPQCCGKSSHGSLEMPAWTQVNPRPDEGESPIGASNCSDEIAPYCGVLRALEDHSRLLDEEISSGSWVCGAGRETTVLKDYARHFVGGPQRMNGPCMVGVPGQPGAAAHSLLSPLVSQMMLKPWSW